LKIQAREKHHDPECGTALRTESRCPRRRGVPTPYLWSYSNLYENGKFVADGRFDPEAVSKQCGAAPMLKAVPG
jgi:lysozyme family protein